jgi:NTP pyrophosphatase (non-canonical NTP hydrolase)
MQAEPRPVVRAIAVKMEQKLRANDHKSYQGVPAIVLFRKLLEEVYELYDAILWKSPEDIAEEAADVNNVATMIADVVGGLRYEGKKAGA